MAGSSASSPKTAAENRTPLKPSFSAAIARSRLATPPPSRQGTPLVRAISVSSGRFA